MKDDHELEASLRRVMAAAPQSDESAVERIVQRLESVGLPPQKRGLLAMLPPALMEWDFAPAWPRIAALACAAVLGISIGLSNVGTRIAANLDLVRVAAADDGGNVFDVDSSAGLRP